MKNWIKCVLFLSIFSSSCRKDKTKFNNIKTVNSQFKISWQSDSNFVAIKPNSKKTLSLTENKSWSNGFLGMSRNFAYNYLELSARNDSVATEAKLFVKCDSLPEPDCLPHFNDIPTIIKSKDSIISRAFQISYHCKQKVFDAISISDLSANEVKFQLTKSTMFYFSRAHFQNIIFSGNIYWKKNVKPRIDIYNPWGESKYVVFENISIGEISTIKTNYITISSCDVLKISSINCSKAEGVLLSDVRFVDSTSYLNLDVNRSENDAVNHNDKTWLIVSDNVDINRLRFDYTNFTYLPGSNYLKSKKIFGQIIMQQRKENHAMGMIQAAIDSSKFEDEQHLISSLFIPIKSWWNSYGYDKTKVISSIIVLFGLVLFINLCVFKYLIQCYPFKEISESFKDLTWKTHKIKTLTTYLFLCFFYTGFVFFGLKFEVDRLKMTSICFSFIVVVEYVIGIISVAYLANLIISK